MCFDASHEQSTAYHQIAILGAGGAGLAAAWKLREQGKKATVYEASDHIGGLMHSFTINGFTFDSAVHLSFTEDALVRKLFDAEPHISHEPSPVCFASGLWIKHPIQNNLYPFSAEFKTRAILDFLARPDDGTMPQNYEEWLVKSYGRTISAEFPERYTQKYWTVPARDLTIDWVGGRMHCPSLQEVLFGAMSPETKNAYYAKAMRYPKRGGYQSFLNTIAASADVKFSHAVSGIDTRDKRLLLHGGQSIAYSHCISTIPLPVLLNMCTTAPEAVRQSAQRLQATSVDLVSVGLAGELPFPNLWCYIYDEDIFAARVYSPSRKSPENAPPGCSSLQFEIYSSLFSKSYGNQDIVDNVVYALQKMGITNEVLLLDHRRLPFGNVIFYHGMNEDRGIVRKWLHQEGIITAGRFGEWDYFWSDQAVLSGIRAAQALDEVLQSA